MAKEKVTRSEYERRLGLWIDALESGKYNQAQGHLCSAGGEAHCCLGVLSDIYIEETGDGLWLRSGPDGRGLDDFHDTLTGQTEASSLTDSVRDWIGLRTEKGSFWDWDTETMGPVPEIVRHGRETWGMARIMLPYLNDGDRSGNVPALTFKQIAAVLKARPNGLFTWTEEEANG